MNRSTIYTISPLEKKHGKAALFHAPTNKTIRFYHVKNNFYEFKL